jgi:type IV pilus assembly protein PilM
MLVSNWITKGQTILPIGLDIGHSSIKMVQLAVRDNDVRILASDRAPVDWDGVVEDEARQDVIIRTIQQLLTRSRFKGRDVISALPPEKLRITSLRLAEVEMDQVERTLRREAAHRFGLDPRVDAIDYVLAGNVRQGDELKSEYILFATDDETIRSHIALLEGAGLQPRGIDAGPCALFRNFERTMRRQEDRERTIIFIDVGHRYTLVVFGRAGEMCFVKQMAFGAARFAEDIAAKLDISTADAESLRGKMQSGESVDAATRRMVVDTLHATAEQLAAEISLCLRYYTVTFRGKRVERAVLAGGGVHETTLLDVMRHHLAIETRVAEPFRGFDANRTDGQGDRQSLSADFALAIGLSLKGTSLSLLEASRSQIRSELALEGVPS